MVESTAIEHSRIGDLAEVSRAQKIFFPFDHSHPKNRESFCTLFLPIRNPRDPHTPRICIAYAANFCIVVSILSG